MDKNVRRLVHSRLIITFLLMFALAAIPPFLYHDSLYNVFFLDDTAKEIASRFSDATRWIHAGCIVAVWALNMIFFSVNRRKNDSGGRLQARTALQNVLNFLLVLVCVAAMLAYRYALSAQAWVGFILPIAKSSVLTLWTPFLVVGGCAVFLWIFCMYAAPAPNCAVRLPIAKKVDRDSKRVERKR